MFKIPSAGPVPRGMKIKPLKELKLKETQILKSLKNLKLKSKKNHSVKEGETLWGIAKSKYPCGNDTEIANAAAAIYMDNKEVIGKDPNLIKPGQELKLPSDLAMMFRKMARKERAELFKLIETTIKKHKTVQIKSR